MKHLEKSRIQEIAKEHGIKSIPFAKFLSRIQNVPQAEVLAVFNEYKENKQTTKRGLLAAELAIEEMGGSLKKPKKKKDGTSKPKKRTSSKKDSGDEGNKPKTSRISNYNYPEDATSEDKKKFRAKARGEAKKWAKLLGEDNGEDNKEYQEFLKATYSA